MAIYLGIPFGIGFSSWLTFNKLLEDPRWRVWYKEFFVPRTAPLTLLALLFTIIIMFILKGHMIIHLPVAVLRVSLPMCSYFVLMFVGVYFCCYRFGFNREETITLAFTSASNNFELAIAVSIAMYGLDSPEAFVGVIGPLVEVPVMLAFVHLAKVLHQRWPTPSKYDHVRQQEFTSSSDSAMELQARPSHATLSAYDCEEAVSPLHATRVMFLCTGNSCRSHMAQAWCWYYHPHLLAYSAGTSPTPGQPGAINPLATAVMLEFGIDIAAHRSKHIQDLDHVAFDLVISVCDDAAQNCPFGVTKPGVRVVHRAFDDPPRLVGSTFKQSSTEVQQQLAEYRRVCEEIRTFVREDLPKLLEK